MIEDRLQLELGPRLVLHAFESILELDDLDDVVDALPEVFSRFRRRIEKLVSNLLQELIRDMGKNRSFELYIDSWANINRSGDYNVVHTHPNCMFSGVYYVTRGNPDPEVPHGGLLEMLDPREAANYIQVTDTVLDARVFFENKPGRMLLWPSWVKHMVHPHVGEGERISIAFNVNVRERT